MPYRPTAAPPSSLGPGAASGSRRRPVSIVVALAVLAGAVWAGCGITEQAVEDLGRPDLLEHLPAGAALVGWADLAAVREADPLGVQEEGGFGEELRDRLPEVEAMTGIDLEHDLHAAAVAASVDEAGAPDGHPLFVLLASYDADRIVAALGDASRHDHRDHTVYDLKTAVAAAGPGDDSDPPGDDSDPPGDAPAAPQGEEGNGTEGSDEARPREDLYLAMPGPELLLVGPRQGVEAALDAGDGESASVRRDPEIMELVNRVPAGREAWMVVDRRALELRLGDLPETTEVPIPRAAIQNLQGLVVSVDVDDGLDAMVDGIAVSEEDAGLLAQSLQGMLALGKMALQQQAPELFAIVDRAVSVSQDGTAVRARAQLSAEDIAALRSRLDERSRADDEAGADDAGEPEGAGQESP